MCYEAASLNLSLCDLFSLIAAAFQWPGQAAETHSVVKLDCYKLNVIQLRKKRSPFLLHSYLLGRALDVSVLL